jgi:Sulfotransferase family
VYLYVMGRGHSGSTILDILLGGGAAVESVGELVSGLEWYEAGTRCACGAPMRECPYWAEVRRGVEADGHDWAELTRASRRQTDVRRWLPIRLAGRDDPELCRLAAMTRSLARAVAVASGKPHVLDSNKEVARGLFLLRYLPEARVIHLVRDPRGIQRSHHWRLREERGFLFMRRRFAGRGTAPLLLLLAAVAWTVGNVLGELTRRAAPDRVLRLRYEDLRRDPAGAVRAIGAAFGLPVEDVVARLEAGEAFPVGHNVCGNHIRHARTVRFDAGAEGARPPLPRWAERATVLLCWPLMRRYGYAT